MTTKTSTKCDSCKDEIKDLLNTHHYSLDEIRPDVFDESREYSEEMFDFKHFCKVKCLKDYVGKLK